MNVNHTLDQSSTITKFLKIFWFCFFFFKDRVYVALARLAWNSLLDQATLKLTQISLPLLPSTYWHVPSHPHTLTI